MVAIIQITSTDHVRGDGITIVSVEVVIALCESNIHLDICIFVYYHNTTLVLSSCLTIVTHDIDLSILQKLRKDTILIGSPSSDGGCFMEEVVSINVIVRKGNLVDSSAMSKQQ